MKIFVEKMKANSVVYAILSFVFVRATFLEYNYYLVEKF